MKQCTPVPKSFLSNPPPSPATQQLDDQADQRCHLHLQPALWPAFPKDHPHERVGWPEAPEPAGQVEDGRGGGCARAVAAGGGAAQAHHRYAQGHA
eukprot:353104-Chlamydomonas_euryale.AAC.4